MTNSNKNYDVNKFNTYLSSMLEHCPYLQPAFSKNLIVNKPVYFEKNIYTLNNLPECIFWEAVKETELFREKRKELQNNEKYLYNVNLIMIYSKDLLDKKLLSWPHFLLKSFYTKLGITFGKFHAQNKEYTKDGLLLNQPPYDHLAIRSSIKRTDIKFFDTTPFLKSELISSQEKKFFPFNYYFKDINDLIDASTEKKSLIYKEIINKAKLELNLQSQ